MQNVLTAIFKTESEGFQAISELRKSPVSEQAAILQMALVKHNEQGLNVCEKFDSGISTSDDTIIGGVIGGLIGILGGPLGVLLMGSYGMLAGSAFDMSDAAAGAALIERVAKNLLEGEIALIALTDETEEAFLDEKLSKFSAEIIRFDAAEVAEEVAEANRIQLEAAKQARKELRADKKAERKQKVEEMRAKLSDEFASLKAKLKKD